MTSRNKPRFFVTGGTGFIGSRLIEVLREDLGVQVTALAHRTSAGALRLAAAGVPLDFTPITDVAGLTKAIGGHDAVFHLAFGKNGSAADIRRTTIDGTSALVEAALAAGVPRFVNVSTAAVYFGAPGPVADESAGGRRWGWDYVSEKLDAEQVVANATAQRGLKGCTFQVSGVYGPWGDTFVSAPLSNMRRGIVVLPNYGNGAANVTFVDDAVQALILGLQDEAVGETFIVRGPGAHTRGEVFGRLEAMLNYKALEGMPTDEVKTRVKSGADWSALARVGPAAVKAIIRDTEVKSAVRRSPLAHPARSLYRRLSARREKKPHNSVTTVAEERFPFIFPAPLMIDFLASEVQLSSGKAERILGYSPRFDLDEGMSITHEWVKWANLAGPRMPASSCSTRA